MASQLTLAQQLVLTADRKRGLEDGPLDEPAQEGEFDRRTRAQMVEALATSIIRNARNMRPTTRRRRPCGGCSVTRTRPSMSWRPSGRSRPCSTVCARPSTS